MPWSESSGRPRVTLPHYGGLDGLRALAVAAVILYHGGVSWAPGGFLGVELFFVLSGFLITSLLVAEWSRAGTIALRTFWGRRARRLLPALFLLVLGIGVYYALAGATKAVPGLEGDGISTLLYANNWHQILNHTNYFAASGPVSPLQHTWSLAIEEQFYLLWPLAVLAVLSICRRRRVSPRRSLQLLLGVTLCGAVASVVDTALQIDGGRGLDRVYYGTDTRAASLLLGAALASTLAIRRTGASPANHRDQSSESPAAGRWRGWAAVRWRGWAVGAAAVAVLAAVVGAIAFARGSDVWLYPYGLLGIDAAVLSLIVTLVLRPRALVTRLLSLPPLRGLGQISYGVYLWHFPLFLWLDEDSTGTRGAALLGVRLAATLAVSLLSFYVVEQPIRRGRRPAWFVRTLAPVGAGAALASLLMASAAASLPTSVSAAEKLPQAPARLAGADGPCQVSLADTSQYGLNPVAPAAEAKFEYTALGYSTLTWSGHGSKTFETCPPKRVMLIGDSLAFTIGLPMMDNEQSYGLQLANAAKLGCAFTTRGQLDVNGTWEDPPAGCSDSLSQWAHDEQALHAQEVVVELGYRDEFDWRWNGRTVHIGQPAFDAYLRQQIDRYVKVLGAGGVKLLFLSVPYTHPPAQADGAPAAAASPARHTEINALLQREARLHPKTVQFLDLDTTVSPQNHYDARVDGQLCRFDGIHFSVFCSKLLEPRVMGEARRLLGSRN